MKQSVNTSETSVSLYQTTRRNIPEDGHLRSNSHENLKYHQSNLLSRVEKLSFAKTR